MTATVRGSGTTQESSRADDHPALQRLAAFDGRAVRRRSAGRGTDAGSMGYQPGLDGLRAISVIAVILYHAGFTWMHGGFFGVEVFFVVSGFLITSLLIEERERSADTSLKGFWGRRARRLLPALFTLLIAVATWAALFGSDEQVSQLRRDLPWSLFYAANWGQIFGDIPYFASGDPPLLRHLWSLAVEEQWYVVWPLLFLVLARARLGHARTAAIVGAAAVASMVFMAWLASSPNPLLGGPPAIYDGVDRTNFMYLSTITRASGLLLGAAAAFVWRPWRRGGAPRVSGRVLDIGAGLAVGALGCIAAVAVLTERYVYQWLLPLVSVLSLVAVLAVVHPAARGTRRIFSMTALVEIGKRSYGVYLWHWPIFVILGATDGAVAPVIAGLLITAFVSEACYRFVETPIRKGALSRWRAGGYRNAAPAWALAVLVGGLALFYVNVQPFDAAAGGEEAAFELETQTSAPTDEAVDPVAPTTSAPAAAVAPTTLPVLPRHVTVVGDSQAHSLAINLPDGIDDTFAITDGSLDGCSVYDSGRVLSARDGFSNSFAMCEGWQDEWASAASGADVALVVLGAWDVFDMQDDGTTYRFGTPQADAHFTSSLQSGIDAMKAAGAHVALLEVACMRPQDVEGAGVPALPERGDDARVAHLNDLLRSAAAADPASVTFVDGPDEWCNDEAIATDLGHRWDGVHVYKPGADLIYETIAPALLAIPTPAN